MLGRQGDGCNRFAAEGLPSEKGPATLRGEGDDESAATASGPGGGGRPRGGVPGHDVHLGGHPYGYTPFAFDLTPHLRRDGDDVLAVRVRNEGRNSRWYSGSGIYRHAWLTTTVPLRIPLWGIAVATRDVSDRKAGIDVAVALENRGSVAGEAVVRVRVLDPGGREVAAAEGTATVAAGAESAVRLSSSVENPRRWSPEHPALHRAVVDVLVGRRVVDHVEETFGIRTVEVDARRGLRINGEPVLLRGACLR
jgi:beta-galactosidase